MLAQADDQFRVPNARGKVTPNPTRAELREKPELIMTLKQQAQGKPITLLYSAHDEKFNQAAALCEILTKSTAKKASRSYNQASRDEAEITANIACQRLNGRSNPQQISPDSGLINP